MGVRFILFAAKMLSLQPQLTGFALSPGMVVALMSLALVDLAVKGHSAYMSLTLAVIHLSAVVWCMQSAR
ncbi:hypothetical protein Q8F55_005220 [Vanrija albida]|uniref:Uncharacterized protein n=1 Tax=Vanrija albida TaxID=181172 RepID=A0ABR3Q1X4_9TREE